MTNWNLKMLIHKNNNIPSLEKFINEEFYQTLLIRISTDVKKTVKLLVERLRLIKLNILTIKSNTLMNRQIVRDI